MQPLLTVAPDTILVVAGVTLPLPAGGTIADAIYNRNRNEVYLTNIELNRLEVLYLSDTTFVVGGVPTGSRPWGIKRKRAQTSFSNVSDSATSLA